MTVKSIWRYGLLACSTLLMGSFWACSGNTENPIITESLGCSNEKLMESFTDTDGNRIFIYEDGKAFLEKENQCEFELQYFDADFVAQNYLIDNTGIFLLDNGTKVQVKKKFVETNEVARFVDLFYTDTSDLKLFWTSFTLQSPQAKTVSEYVALSKCILNETCDFLDNRMDIVEDPVNSSNKVIRFESVAPTDDMITSKCSLTSVLSYFENGNDIWFEADYFLESGMPFSLVDFESSYFFGSPGPRVVIDNGKLALENKFGAKLRYDSTSEITVPTGQWFTVKVHLKFSNDNTGVLELWQNGEELISTTGINMQTSNGIQNILEVGISATQTGAVLLMDNIKVSDSKF